MFTDPWFWLGMVIILVIGIIWWKKMSQAEKDLSEAFNALEAIVRSQHKDKNDDGN